MIKIAAAFVLALLIGAGCRWLNIPLPAPPTFIGALLIVAITAGYSTTDYLMGRAAKGSERSNVSAPAAEVDPAAGPEQPLDR